MLHKLKSTITNTKIKGRRTHQPRTATFDSVSTPLSGRAPSPFVQAAAIAQGDGSDSPKFVGSPLARSPVKTANGPMDSSGTPEVVDPAAILASLKKTGNGTLPRGETPKSLAVPDATQGAVPSRQISSVSETASPATVDSTPLARGAVVAAPAIEHMASFQTVSTSNFTAGQGGSFMSGTTVSSKAAPVPSTPTTSAAATNTTPAASAVLSSATDPVLSTTSTANAVVNDNTTAVAATPVSATRQLVRANYSFYGENSEELTLAKGDVVAVIQEISEGWWVGELNGNRGMFPANYCEPVMDASTLADVSEGSQPIIQKSRERMDAIIADDHNEDTLIQSIHESIHSSKVKAIPAMTAMSQAEQVTSQEVSDVPDSILDIYAAGGNGSVSDVALDDGPASAPVEAASTSAPQALPLAVPVQAATSIPSHLVVSPTTAKAQEYTASMVNLERQTDKHMEALQAAMLEFQAELVPMPDAATVEPVPVVVAAPVAVAQPVAKALTAKPTQTPSTTPAQTHKNAPMSPAHANLSVAETLYAPSTSSLGRGKNVAANTAPAAAKTNLAMAETLFIPSSPSRGKNVAVAAAAPLAAGESPSQTPVESHMTAAQKYQMKAMAQAAAMNRRNSLTANTAQVLPGELAVAPAALAQGSPALAKKESLKAVPSLSPGSTPSSPALTQKDVTKAMAAGAASAAAVTAELSSTVAPGTVGACVSCGCNSFVAGAFKREKCSNCFHTH